MGLLPDCNAGLFPNLMREIEIRHHRIRNRLFFPSMGLDLANADGTLSHELCEFYRNIVAGGVGMFVLGNATVSPESQLVSQGLKLFNDKQGDALGKFSKEFEHLGVSMAVQLQHYGAQTTTRATGGRPLPSPSGIKSIAAQHHDPNYAVFTMDKDDIAHVVRQFADAARFCTQAGVRMIQLQASNGYLLSSFLSPATNMRDDEYGGDEVRRGRFLLDVVMAVREVISPDTILGVRIQVDDMLDEGGLKPSHLRPVIPLLEDAGVDLFEASFCVADNFYKFSQRSPELMDYFAAQVKSLKEMSRVPVGFAGMVANMEQADELIANHVCDLVGMGRALLADNYLPRKSLSGKDSEIHYCLWDGACFKDKFDPRLERVHCCVNPNYLRPDLLPITGKVSK